MRKIQKCVNYLKKETALTITSAKFLHKSATVKDGSKISLKNSEINRATYDKIDEKKLEKVN